MYLDPGAIIADRYEVISRLGSGGMADVYLVADKLMKGKQVALKLLSSKVSEDEVS